MILTRLRPLRFWPAPKDCHLVATGRQLAIRHNQTLGLSLAIATLLALSGCTAIPPKPSDLRANAARLESRTLDSADIRVAIRDAGLASQASIGPWSVDALTVAAWQQRSEIAEARFLTLAATADRTVAAEPAPISLSIIPEFVRQAGGGSPWSLMATLTWLIPNPSRQAAHNDGAVAAMQSAAWQQAQVTWQVTAEVRNAWMAWVDSNRSIAIAQEGLHWRDEKMRLAQKRVALGYSPSHSLESLRILQAQALSELETALTQQRQALVHLAHACGLPSDGLDHVQLAPDAAPIATPDWSAMQALATFNNLDLALALSRYALAEAAEREQLSARIPSLTLGPGLGFDHGDHKWTLAASADLPSQVRRLAIEDASRARREAAAAAVLTVQADRQSQLAQLRSEWVALQAQARASELILVTGQSATEALIKGWRAGRNTRDDVIDSEIQMLQIKQDRERLVVRQHALIASLEQIVQRPIWPASDLNPPFDIQNRQEAPHDLSAP